MFYSKVFLQVMFFVIITGYMVHASGHGLPKLPHMLLTIVTGVSLYSFYLLNIIFSFFILVKYNDNMKKSSKQKYFIDDWLTHDDFKIWLRKDPLGNKKTRCAICHKSFELSSSGGEALTNHAKSKKHQDALLRVKTFFKKPSTENTQE